MGYKAKSFLGFQVKILTDKAHKKARISLIDTDAIKKELKHGAIAVVAGFQGVDETNNYYKLSGVAVPTQALLLLPLL